MLVVASCWGAPWAHYTLEATSVCMPKMMLPATQTSCLKYSHTNLQGYIGIKS
jgi:hypothetical protein